MESQLQGQRTPNVKNKVLESRPHVPKQLSIKQELIDVDALSNGEVQMIPALTIKHDPVRGDTPPAKRVKSEEDTLVDLLMYEDFEIENLLPSRKTLRLKKTDELRGSIRLSLKG